MTPTTQHSSPQGSTHTRRGRTTPPASIPAAPGTFAPLTHPLAMLRNPLAFVEGLHARGDLVRVRLGMTSAVVVCDPDLTHQVLLDDRTFDRGGALNERSREVFGDGLATCPRGPHRRLRRLVQPAFHAARLPADAQVMTDQIAAVTGTWHDGQLLDLSTETMAITGRVMVTAMLSDTLSESTFRQAINDLTTVVNGIYRRMLLPSSVNALPIPANRRYRQAYTRLRHIIAELITGCREGRAHPAPALKALLDARDPDTDSVLSDAELTDNILILFLAGMETTASVAHSALNLLARNPEIEHALHTELDTVLAGRTAAYADLPNLELTGRVISETLRIYPPGWILTRTTTEDTELGGHRIPAGTTLACIPYLIQHRPDLFPDPDRFDPDRWLPQNATNIPRHAYLPFGAGARKCIGDRFGATEAALILATIASRWQLRPPANAHPGAHAATSLRPAERRMLLTARTPRPHATTGHDAEEG